MASSSGVLDPNKAYPSLLNLLPSGLKGLSFAALTAAIVASLAGKANSIATIFTLDIYKKAINPAASDKLCVNLGKISVVVAMALGVIISLLIGDQLMGEGKQGFQYIQEYTGFISPGVFAIFILGFFWKRTTSNAALAGALLSIPLSTLIKFTMPEMPFLDRMGWIFVIIIAIMVIMTLLDPKSKDNPKGLEVDSSMFKTSGGFAIGAILVCGILAALYTVFW